MNYGDLMLGSERTGLMLQILFLQVPVKLFHWGSQRKCASK